MAYRETDRVYDELLLTLARGGDARAGERLAKRWLPRLLRTAKYLLGDDDLAREAVQDAWAGICRGWWRLSDPANFGPWAFGILRRKCVDQIRANQKRRARQSAEPYDSKDALRVLHVEHGNGASGEAGPANPVHPAGDDAIDLADAFAQLTPKIREAAVLFFVEGFTVDEIATALSIPAGTVKSRIFAARKSLINTLKGEDI